MKKTLIVALFVICHLVRGALVCQASEANPCGNHGNNCCTDDGGQSYQSTESTCVQVVEANPKAYCESYAAAVAASVSNAKAQSLALAICGDATSFCEGGNAFALACVKQSCEQAAVQTAVASQECGSASQSCGDTAQTCNVTCPVCPQPPDVEVGTRVLKCRRWKQLPNGSYVGKKCLTITESYPKP